MVFLAKDQANFGSKFKNPRISAFVNLDYLQVSPESPPLRGWREYDVVLNLACDVANIQTL